MGTLYQPKESFYNLLNTIGNDSEVVVYQNRPEVLTEISDKVVVTFSLLNNGAILTLDKDIGVQDIEFKVDVYAKDSVTSGAWLTTIEGVLRENDYAMTFSSDVPDPDGYAHLTSRFKIIH